MPTIIINTPQVTIVEQVPQELLDRVTALEEGNAALMASVQELQESFDTMQTRVDEAFDAILARVDELEQDVSNSIQPGDLDPVRSEIEGYRSNPPEVPGGGGETAPPPEGGGGGEAPPEEGGGGETAPAP